MGTVLAQSGPIKQENFWLNLAFPVTYSTKCHCFHKAEFSAKKLRSVPHKIHTAGKN
jgi:hypothetical protein